MNENLTSKAKNIISLLGGENNISLAENCMTRLRITVADESMVNEEGLSSDTDVLSLIHDKANYFEIVVGPGKSRKYADEINSILNAGSSGAKAKNVSVSNNWKENKDAFKGKKQGRLKGLLKTFGEIFVPLIPGVIAAGLCAGFASLITQLVPDYADSTVWNLIYRFLSLINVSFMTYITAWVGYRAAEKFGATAILGGMLGLITSLDGINTIAQILGLYNEGAPLESVLRVGRGGVLAVIVGVYILSIVEKKIRKIMPDSIDIVFTPLLSILICVIPYVLIVMPLLGFVSTGICKGIGFICMSPYPAVRLIAGFIASALFLPLVAFGMHHGLVALYTTQLQAFGYITLYPALAMAGAGQVGAAIALLILCKKYKEKRLTSIIRGALPAGILGIGEPLIYGVTLPLGLPFITAGLGAGFGGAFVTLMQVASTTWGPSGLLGGFVMTSGPNGALKSIIFYYVGLAISYVMSFIITYFVIISKPGRIGFVKEAATKSAEANNQPEALAAPDEATSKYAHISRGSKISLDYTCSSSDENREEASGKEEL